MVLSLQVYKKSSSNGQLCLYVGQRNFTDHLTHVDPVEGLLVVNSNCLEGQRVFMQAVLTYRYGREEDEVMGLTFAKEIVVSSYQVYPKLENNAPATDPLSQLQDRLMRKIGDTAHPFLLQLPREAPASVTLQPGADDRGKPCGVEWELRAVVGDSPDATYPNKCFIRMGIRRYQFSQLKEGIQPYASCEKEFLLSPGKVHLHITLDKQIYFQGESVSVQVQAVNHSHKQIKKLKISVLQLCDVSLGVSGQLRNVLSTIESQEDCPVSTGMTLQKTFSMIPTLDENHHKRGLAIDSQMHRRDPCLAPSTLFSDPNRREMFGVVVSYVARVKLLMGKLGGEMATEVPFTLLNHSAPMAVPPALVVPQLTLEDQEGLASDMQEDDEEDEEERSDLPQLLVEEGHGPAFSDTEPDSDMPEISFQKEIQKLVVAPISTELKEDAMRNLPQIEEADFSKEKVIISEQNSDSGIHD